MAEASEESTGGTNVVVEGVDELDLVERLSDERALFASATALVLVDLADGERVARTAVTPGAQITYDPESGQPWTRNREAWIPVDLLGRTAIG